MSLFGVALARVLSTRAVVRLGRMAGTVVAVGFDRARRLLDYFGAVIRSVQVTGTSTGK